MSRHSLITGGAGFIGSHLVERLLAEGWRVTVVDDLSTGRLSNVAALIDRGELTFIHGRIGDVLRRQPDLLHGVEHVYHLAASVGVRLVVDDPAAAIRNNVQETAAVLDAANAAGVKALVASSSEVYGQCPVLPLREDAPLVYGPTSRPRWSYGMAKALDEHLALHPRKGSGSFRGHVVVRLFNTIGPRQVGRYGMVVPRMIGRALRGEPIEVHGDGRQTRTFCDARDVVGAMVRLMAEDRLAGTVYNLGSDQARTIDEVADAVLQLSASRAGKRYVPYEEAYGPDFEDPPQRLPDLTRIRTAIGFEPTYSFEATLQSVLAYERRMLESGRAPAVAGSHRPEQALPGAGMEAGPPICSLG